MAPSLSRGIPNLARSLALLSLGSLLPASAFPQGPGEFDLEYQPQLFSSSRQQLSAKLRREVYWEAGTAADPELEGRKVRRGAIRVSDERIVRLAWDESGEVLFVDRDGDGELSDEAPLAQRGYSGAWWYYDNFQLQAPGGREHGVWEVHLTISRLPGSTLSASVYVQSGWTGKVELGGAEYRLAVFDDLDGVFTTGSDHLALLPWTELGRIPAFDAVALPGRVLVGKTIYDLTVTLEAGGDGGIVRARFTETSAPLIDVELVGTHVQSLLFEAKGDGPDSTAVFLSDPSATLRLPEGEYYARVKLDGGELGPLYSNLDVVVSPEGEQVLRAGCPLANGIEYRRASASTLEVQYRLRGVGGEEYDLPRMDSVAPTFVARIGDREVASESFEYG